MNKKYSLFQIFISLFFLNAVLSCTKKPSEFNSNNALHTINKQIELGPRIPGSESSKDFSKIVHRELANTKWKIENQEFNYRGTNLTNIIIKNPSDHISFIIGTHYDTRRFSDREKSVEKRSIPVPGANDGASGTAILIELAKSLEPDQYPGLGFVLFDAEDQGEINGWDWSVGSAFFVDNLKNIPEQVIIIDMVGDKDLQIYMEQNSDPWINHSLWKIADELGYSDTFINEYGYSMMDDHSPFLLSQIPAALLIDFDYPYWHTNEDTVDKVSANSLETVAKVLRKWLDDYVKSPNK